jgi:flagellar hook-length control protein FliK
MGAGGSASPAGAFEAMLAALFGPVAGQGAGLFAAAGPKAADKTAANDKGADAAADPQCASPQTQSLIASLMAVVPQPATQTGGAPPAATGAPAAPPGGGSAATPAIAAGAPLAGPFPGLGKAAEAASGPAAPAAPKAPPTTDIVDPANLQPPAVPAAKAALAPEPPAPPAAPAPNPAQPALAAQAVPTPDPTAAGAKPDPRPARNDSPRRNAALFANPGVTATPTTAPPSLRQAAQAGAGVAPSAGLALATAPQAVAGDAPRTGEAAPAAGDAPQDHAQAPAPTEAPPLTSAPTMAAPAVVVRGAPETVANLAAQILKKLDGRSTRFDVELDPAGLGRVDVRLEIGAHGRMTAAMAFDNPQAAQELRSRSGELTRALEQAGFDVSGGLSFDVAGDPGQSGRGTPQDNDANTGSAWRGRAFQAALDATADADAAPAGGLNLSRRLLAGVDIKI